MLKGKTKSGFVFAIPEANFDMEFIDCLADIEGGNMLAFSTLPKLLFRGTDLRKKLYDHVRKEDGTVSPEDIERELSEIFKAREEVKNS